MYLFIVGAMDYKDASFTHIEKYFFGTDILQKQDKIIITLVSL